MTTLVASDRKRQLLTSDVVGSCGHRPENDSHGRQIEYDNGEMTQQSSASNTTLQFLIAVRITKAVRFRWMVKAVVCFRRWRTATLGLRRRTVVGCELPMENYSGVLQMETCCALGTENNSGSL